MITRCSDVTMMGSLAFVCSGVSESLMRVCRYGDSKEDNIMFTLP